MPVRDGSGITNLASEDEAIYETITKHSVVYSFPILLSKWACSFTYTPSLTSSKAREWGYPEEKVFHKVIIHHPCLPTLTRHLPRPLCTPQILSGFPKFICALLFIYVQLTCETAAERSRRSQVATHVLNNNTHPKDLTV